jgi:hypothetical protein
LIVIEDSCRTLYHPNLDQIMESIPAIVQAVEMIIRLSHGSHVSERVTSLMVKIANQMIETCYAFLFQVSFTFRQLVRNIIDKTQCE